MAHGRGLESLDYPYLRVSWKVPDVEGQGLAYLDTGFDGHLCLPESIVDALGLPDLLVAYRLAGNQRVRVPAYEGSVTLLGLDISLPASILALGDEMILGRHIVDRFWVTFDHGQRVLLEP